MDLDTQTPELRGLNLVRVSKDELLDKIRGNAAEHHQIFEEALDGWHKAVIQRLEEMVADAKAGRDIALHVGLQRPEDHSDDYESVIALLEMSQDDELEITFHDFQQYVMDKWGWQNQFLMSSTAYGSETARGKFSGT